MNIVISVFKTIIAAILAIITSIAPAAMNTSDKSYEPLSPQTCLLQFAAISDTHFYDADNPLNLYSEFMYGLIASDMENAAKKPDALVVAGDITNYGTEAEWQNSVNIFSKFTPAEKILLGIGNHDSRTEEENKTAKQLFVDYSNKITGNKIKNVYYSTKLNGYYFIFLGSEKDSTNAYFSSKQISWLKSEMKKAAKTKNPVFVISHWPLNKTHGLPVTFGDTEYDDMTGGIGEQSNKIKSILNKYKNVFYISGHIHNGISNKADSEKNGYQSVEAYGNITSINLPASVLANINGNQIPGSGFSIEVYKKEVVIRARNFAAGCWMPDYDYTVKLK